MIVAVMCGARSGFSKKKRTTETAVMIKWRSGSKLMSVLRGWSDPFIVRCQERLKKSPSMSDIRELDLSRNRFWNKFLTRVEGLRAKVKARSKKRGQGAQGAQGRFCLASGREQCGCVSD